jgi:hypothetical protein
VTSAESLLKNLASISEAQYQQQQELEQDQQQNQEQQQSLQNADVATTATELLPEEITEDSELPLSPVATSYGQQMDDPNLVVEVVTSSNAQKSASFASEELFDIDSSSEVEALTTVATDDFTTADESEYQPSDGHTRNVIYRTERGTSSSQFNNHNPSLLVNLEDVRARLPWISDEDPIAQRTLSACAPLYSSMDFHSVLGWSDAPVNNFTLVYIQYRNGGLADNFIGTVSVMLTALLQHRRFQSSWFMQHGQVNDTVGGHWFEQTFQTDPTFLDFEETSVRTCTTSSWFPIDLNVRNNREAKSNNDQSNGQQQQLADNPTPFAQQLESALATDCTLATSCYFMDTVNFISLAEYAKNMLNDKIFCRNASVIAVCKVEHRNRS